MKVEHVERVNAVTPAKIMQYKTDLRGCGCPARRFKENEPCKHMKALLKAKALLDASERKNDGEKAATRDNGIEPRGGRPVVNAGANGNIWDRL